MSASLCAFPGNEDFARRLREALVPGATRLHWRRFRDGEAVTSALFASQLSAAFDWLITVDAHMHRRRSLSEIYSIPARDVSASAGVSRIVTANTITHETNDIDVSLQVAGAIGAQLANLTPVNMPETRGRTI